MHTTKQSLLQIASEASSFNKFWLPKLRNFRSNPLKKTLLCWQVQHLFEAIVIHFQGRNPSVQPCSVLGSSNRSGILKDILQPRVEHVIGDNYYYCHYKFIKVQIIISRQIWESCIWHMAMLHHLSFWTLLLKWIIWTFSPPVWMLGIFSWLTGAKLRILGTSKI